MKKREMMLLRSLLPSWKFFEDIGSTAILFFKMGDGGWKPFHHQIPRRFWHLFFNPLLNLQLAEKSALQHAVRDLTEENNLGENKNLVSVEIIENIVRSRVSSGQNFQFKISILQGGADLEDIFISEICE